MTAPIRELAPHRSADQVARLGFDIVGRLDPDVDDRRPLEHVARLGIGQLDRLHEVAPCLGDRDERAPVHLVGEQRLDQPRRDRVPALHEQRDRDELGVLAALRPAASGGRVWICGRRVRRSATATRSATGSPTCSATWPA